MFDAISPWPVALPATDLRAMTELARNLYRLSITERYQQQVLPLCPESARFDPGHDSVMMGYDYHLTAEGPKLIEINTNAGGSLLAWIAYARHHGLAEAMPASVKAQLLQTFAEEWHRFGGKGHPQTIAIIDENPAEQHLFGEMEFFAELFHAWGAHAWVVDPSELEPRDTGLYLRDRPVDMVYNRHTDFYLETDALQPLLHSYLQKQVCLTPNPHTYGLLGDKRRLLQLSDPAFREPFALDDAVEDQFAKGLLACRLLADCDRDQVWQDRKTLVFKPVNHYGGKGVLLGKSISHKRFEALPPGETLVQTAAPPNVTDAGELGPMKTDYRLFMYRDRMVGLTARLYQGQLTNLRTEGGGFAPVEIRIDEETPR